MEEIKIKLKYRSMWVKDYIQTVYDTISPEADLAEAVKKMVDSKTNSLIVIDSENHPVGIVSSYLLIKEVVPDYLKNDPNASQFGAEGTFDKYVKAASGKKVVDIMYKEFHNLSLDDAMIEAASYMIEANRRLLPVVDGEGRLAGIINRTSVKNAIYKAIYEDK